MAFTGPGCADAASVVINTAFPGNNIMNLPATDPNYAQELLDGKHGYIGTVLHVTVRAANGDILQCCPAGFTFNNGTLT